MIINSNFTVVDLPPITAYSEGAIKNEPMLFNCDLITSMRIGGQITREVLHMLPDDWSSAALSIDSRAHMLMRGWMPCIPGWHHDDVPRTRQDGQPNYGPGQVRSEHIMALVNGGICPTEFATGSANFEEPALGETIYGVWDKHVQLLCDNKVLKRHSVPSNVLVKFDDRTWHQGVPAVANGWRFFIRISRYFSDDGQPIGKSIPMANESRKQVQVYLPTPKAGW